MLLKNQVHDELNLLGCNTAHIITHHLQYHNEIFKRTSGQYSSATGTPLRGTSAEIVENRVKSVNFYWWKINILRAQLN